VPLRNEGKGGETEGKERRGASEIKMTVGGGSWGWLVIEKSAYVEPVKDERRTVGEKEHVTPNPPIPGWRKELIGLREGDHKGGILYEKEESKIFLVKLN